MTKAMFTFLRSTAERWPDKRSASNQLIIILLYQNLKDEGQFRKNLGRGGSCMNIPNNGKSFPPQTHVTGKSVGFHRLP